MGSMRSCQASYNSQTEETEMGTLRRSVQSEGVTDLQSDTHDVERVFNLWMLSPMSQLLAHPDAQTAQSHAPDGPESV